jgi:hypothetical protein
MGGLPFTETIPAPLACDGVTTYDPATRSLLVKVVGFGASFWRRGHRAMVAADQAGRYDAQSVFAHAPGRRDIARASLCRTGG